VWSFANVPDEEVIALALADEGTLYNDLIARVIPS